MIYCLCVPVLGADLKFITRDSKIELCDGCEAKIYVAPSTTEIRKTKALTLICEDCFCYFDIASTTKIDVLTEMQKEETLDTFIKNHSLFE